MSIILEQEYIEHCEECEGYTTHIDEFYDDTKKGTIECSECHKVREYQE